MNMIKLTCSDNLNSRLTGDIGKKPNLDNPVYSNNKTKKQLLIFLTIKKEMKINMNKKPFQNNMRS